jgi:hypothetical protein
MMSKFGVSDSDRRTRFAALMPEGNNFQGSASHTVIHEVPNARKVQPANHVGPRRFDFGTDAWLLNQQRQRCFNILAYCAGSGGAILSPPGNCPLQLALRARLDPDAERHDQPKR